MQHDPVDAASRIICKFHYFRSAPRSPTSMDHVCSGRQAAWAGDHDRPQGIAGAAPG